MGTKIALFIGMFLLFMIVHYMFYSFYVNRTKNYTYTGSIGSLFLFIGIFASLAWTLLIFSNNYRGLLFPLTTIPSAFIALIMLIRIFGAIFIKSSRKKGHFENEQKQSQENYLSLTRGKHYDYIINIYKEKSNPLVTQRDYEIACIYSKKNSIIDSLKAQNKYYELAIFYFLQNNFKEAMKYFDLAGESNSNYKFFYNKGLCLTHLKNYEEAVEAFDKAITFSPNPYAYFNRALAKARLNNVTGTVQDLKSSIDDKDVKNAVKTKRKLDFIEKFISSK